MITLLRLYVRQARERPDRQEDSWGEDAEEVKLSKPCSVYEGARPPERCYHLPPLKNNLIRSAFRRGSQYEDECRQDLRKSWRSETGNSEYVEIE